MDELELIYTAVIVRHGWRTVLSARTPKGILDAKGWECSDFYDKDTVIMKLGSNGKTVTHPYSLLKKKMISDSLLFVLF